MAENLRTPFAVTAAELMAVFEGQLDAAKDHYLAEHRLACFNSLLRTDVPQLLDRTPPAYDGYKGEWSSLILPPQNMEPEKWDLLVKAHADAWDDHATKLILGVTVPRG